jgi:hypothetical protein
VYWIGSDVDGKVDDEEEDVVGEEYDDDVEEDDRCETEVVEALQEGTERDVGVEREEVAGSMPKNQL